MDEEIKNTESEKQKTVNEDVHYDTLLSSAGELGRYQVLLLVSTFPFYMFGINVYYSQLFMTVTPSQHWCWIPELENLTDVERRNLAIPKDENARYGYSHCQAYDANWTDVIATGRTLNDTCNTVPCLNGWEFDRSEIPYPTISTDLEWVCDKKSYQANAQSIFFAGAVVGGILIGLLADKFGRVPATVTSNMLGCVGGLSSTFASNFTQFSICRFVMGMAHDSCMMMPFLIVLENMAPKYRSVLSNGMFAVSYSLFATTFPFIALACGHWKTISLVSSGTLALALLTPLFVPESPRWILSKKGADKAIEKILGIGRVNKKEVPTKLIRQFKDTYIREQQEERVSSFEMLKRPLLRRILILVCLDYMCCQIVFDGLVRNLEQLDFDFFISFAVSSFTEFPSMMLCAFIMDYFGRRWLTVSMLSVICVCCVIIVFVGSGTLSVVCAVVARFATNIACSTVMQWSAELLPTQVRGTGMSLVHISSSLGIIVSPYIAYLKVYIYWLPYVIIGGLAACGAVISMILPETAMKDMPHTFDDAEKLARDSEFWEMPCLKKYRKERQGHVNEGLEL